MDIALIITGAGALIALLAWLLPRRQKVVVQLPQGHGAETTAKGLVVTLSFGFLTFENPRRLSDQMLFINTANASPRPLRITAVGLRFDPGGRYMPWLQPASTRQLPFVLQETENNQFWAPLGELGDVLTKSGFKEPLKMRAFVRDSFDVEHVSDWKECFPQRWAAPE